MSAYCWNLPGSRHEPRVRRSFFQRRCRLCQCATAVSACLVRMDRVDLASAHARLRSGLWKRTGEPGSCQGFRQCLCHRSECRADRAGTALVRSRGVFRRMCTRGETRRRAGRLGYQDIEPPQKISTAVDAFRDEIASYWPPERAFIDSGYADFEWPFANVETPILAMTADWPLARLLGCFSSFSAVKNFREATGRDPAAAHAAAIASAWGDAETGLHLQWPFFLHARRM